MRIKGQVIEVERLGIERKGYEMRDLDKRRYEEMRGKAETQQSGTFERRA